MTLLQVQSLSKTFGGVQAVRDVSFTLQAGELTLNGVTKPVTLEAKLLGEGKDPWGGYRAGFEAEGEITLKDFNITKDLGPASQKVQLMISVEGVRQ